MQWGFSTSRAKVQIFGGAYANGKTTAMAVKGLNLAVQYPGSIGLAARATYPKLNDTLRKVVLKWCPPKWVKRYPTQDDNTMYLQNKSEIHFRYIAQRGKNQADGSTTSNLLSATYDWIMVDQIEDPEIQHKDFLDLAGRLRGDASYRPTEDEDPTMPSTGPRWMMLALNPTRNWVYKELIHPFHMYKKHGIRLPELIVDENGEPLIELFESDIYANAENLAKDAIQLLEAMYKGQMRERFLYGKWAAFEGLVYPDFDPDHNVLTRARILEHLDDCLARHVKVKVVEGYDFGLVSPSCYLLGFTDDYGRLFLLDGYYEPEFKFDRQPDAIREIRSRYIGKLSITEPINADPAIFRRQVVAGTGTLGTTVDTIARLYQNEGIFMRPGTNDITSGVAKMAAYIAGVPKVPSLIEGAKMGTLMYVAQELNWWHDEVGSYYWKKNPLGQMVDEPAGTTDHAMDATKYMLCRLPEASKVQVPKDKLPPQWMYWHDMEVNDYNDALRRQTV